MTDIPKKCNVMSLLHGLFLYMFAVQARHMGRSVRVIINHKKARSQKNHSFLLWIVFSLQRLSAKPILISPLCGLLSYNLELNF